MNKIHGDLQNFQSLSLDWDAYMDLFAPILSPIKALNLAKHDLALAPHWKPLQQTKFVNEGTTTLADISVWRSGCLLLTKTAAEVLEPFLNDCGELLPLASGEVEAYLFNCLLTKPLEEAQSTDIFKSSPSMGIDLYCSDRFKKAVEDSSLSGIYFTKDLTTLA
ncbi:hypothetical protein R50072_13500 [Simiduia litorea]|uniref:hypothetical protein n=1 Tax=Simiduia litorea TaxID=1435348 RepID=UPI0036F1B7F0